MYKNESCASCKGMSARLARMPANVRIAVRAVLHVCTALLCAGAAFIFAACDFFTPTWNEPIGEWFEKYTNEAAIDRHEFFASTYADKDGNICIGSEADCTITFYLRNPKKYDLKPAWTAANSSVPASSVSVIQDASDRSIIRMTLPQSFLLVCEQNNKDEERNISPTIHIAQHENGAKIREFADYSFNLFANSKPPELLSPTVLKNTKDSDNPSFVVAFNVPASADSFRVHKDIVKLTISGGRHNSTWEYSVAPPQTANGSFTFTATGTAPVLKTSRDANWDVIDGRDFSEISGRCFYFETGEYVNGTVAYTLTLTDAAGLASSVQARTGIPKLQPPELRCDGISLFNSATILADSGKDAKTVEIVRTGKDHNGGSVAGTELHWQLLQDGSVKKSGSASSNALLDLEKGAWVIKAWETKAGYDKSDALVCAVKVSTAIRYVSASGNDGNPGTKAAPFATLQKAIEDMGDSSEDWRVIVSGTISDTAATINSDVQANSVTIEGDGTNSTLTGDGSNVVLNVTNLPVNVKDVIINGNGKTGIAITSATVTAENVTITDTSTSPGSFGITVKNSGQFVMKTDCKIEKQTIGVQVVGSSFTMEGGAITGCSSSSNGSGVKVEQSGTFTMTGGAISGNTSTSGGAGVYVDNSTFIMTGGTINNNTATGNSNGGGVYLNTATMFMSGKAAIGIKTAGENDSNEAKNGAGVYVTNSTLYVGYVQGENGNAVPDSSSNCGILGNVAAGAGGGVYVANKGIMYITGGNVISSNKADAPTVSSSSNGGGVYVESGCFMHITDGAIIGQNTATGDGGGVYAEGSVTIQNCNISNNRAERGGGMYLANGSVIYTMSNGYIVDNIAQAGGGGIYLEAGDFIMSSGEIKGNKAETAGGGVYVDAATFTMEGGIIGKEASAAATQSVCSNYAGVMGGGVYVSGNLTMSGGKIACNYAGSMGGGVCVGGSQGVSFEMSGNASVCYNGSSTNGGGVYFSLNSSEGDSFSMADNAAITGNNASQSDGGGIYGIVNDADAISFNGGSITKNSATSLSSAQYYIEVYGNSNRAQNDINDVTAIVLN